MVNHVWNILWADVLVYALWPLVFCGPLLALAIWWKRHEIRRGNGKYI
jgi:hypothetical protein